ncbi:MAG TPA: helix-turn-helix domain-containing protein, partial [Mycobacteriales bacterium]|nr:helix-turn-helix domain-containing protein [Mycobacteriales bacterium]
HPVRGDAGLAGGVVDVKVVEAAPAPDEHGGGLRMMLPGLIGSGALWRRACVEAEAVYRSQEWLVVQGEPGAGKLAVLRAVHQRVDPAGHFSVLDGAASGERGWLTQAREVLSAPGGGAVVLRHLDDVDAVTLRALADALRSAAEPPGGADGEGRRVWVAACVREAEPGADLAQLLQAFPSTVQVPPLRHHVEDVQQLVPFLLRRLGHGQLSCSPEAMQLLLRAQWPGNVEQLLGVLRGVGRLRRTGAITPADLPPEIGVVSRRRLTPLESMERDAIVRALIDARGNKADAARALGVSRATIYRKIHDYGIVAP